MSKDVVTDLAQWRKSVTTSKRVAVLDGVAAILKAAERSPRSGLPNCFTHRELACLVYGVDEPTAAQGAAVRRAVGNLVAAGIAERDPERAFGISREYDSKDPQIAQLANRTGTHDRVVRRREFEGLGRLYLVRLRCRNPGGVLVRRTLTDVDREARAKFVEKLGVTDYADRIRRGEAT
jgi:hypothetical protein